MAKIYIEDQNISKLLQKNLQNKKLLKKIYKKNIINW